MNLQALITNLFIGGVGLTISAIGTWLVYLTLLVFDVNKEQAIQGKEDEVIRRDIESIEEELKGHNHKYTDPYK